MKTRFGTETVDELDRKDFKGVHGFSEFRKEKRRLVEEYRMAGMNVYSSSRCTRDWKN